MLKKVTAVLAAYCGIIHAQTCPAGQAKQIQITDGTNCYSLSNLKVDDGNSQFTLSIKVSSGQTRDAVQVLDSQGNVVFSVQSSGHVFLANDRFIRQYDTGSAFVNVAGLANDNTFKIGPQSQTPTNGHTRVFANGTEVARLEATAAGVTSSKLSGQLLIDGTASNPALIVLNGATTDGTAFLYAPNDDPKGIKSGTYRTWLKSVTATTATTSLDFTRWQTFHVYLNTASTTLTAANNAGTTGQVTTIVICQDQTGGRVVNPDSYYFQGWVAPSGTANKCSVQQFLHMIGKLWAVGGNGM